MEQLSLFPEQQVIGMFQSPISIDGCQIVDISLTPPKKRYSPNYKKGGKQTVYPIRSYDDIVKMTNWILEHKERKYVLAFVLGINVGLRANELLSLRMKDVFNPDGSVRYAKDIEDVSDVIYVFQAKTDKYRPIFLNDSCKAALEWYFPVRNSNLYSEDYLFPSREGGSIKVDTFRKVLKEAATACGVKVNIGTHTCRKTFAYNVWLQTPEIRTDITMIQSILGHSDPKTTMRYLGIDQMEFKKVYHKLLLNVVEDRAFQQAIDIIADV